ncbi:hypothetical protein D915_006150 [Fasciola hepatica]|uniref:Apple domain-containing protein n=1 Tax=Fasciola hepatica TaxID=6192 RepID=A0A4E0RP06_FASHE|nr:hypothetical protein D915_006150 [Fasciola hepatica]
MPQRAASVLLICQLTLIHRIQCLCPVGFTDVGDSACMFITAQYATYCQAHEYCEKEGMARGLRLFLPSRHAENMTKLLPDGGGAFTGLTKLLVRLATDMTVGWRYSDPGWSSFATGPGGTSIRWQKNQVSTEAALIGLYAAPNLWDVTQFGFSATHVICELSTYITNTTNDPLQLDWPYSMSTMFLPDAQNEGCFTSYNVSSLFDCCGNCRSRSACRAFYYHLETAQCWISLYVDSLLPSNLNAINGTWWRFGRPKW